MRLIEKAGAYVLFLPPFSPDFNPIEKMFHVYKAALKRLHFDRRKQSKSAYDLHCIAI